MNDEALTVEERALMNSWSGRSQDAFSRLGYYAAILLPLVVFAIYGLAKRDVVAIAIAFGGLLLYQLWNIGHDLSRVAIYRSLMTKMAAREAGRAPL